MDTKRLKQIYWRIYPFIRSMIRPADRQQSPSSISSGDEKLTRDCLDPWNYLEVSAEGMVKPCCILPPLENILQAPPDRNSNRFRELRKSLLSGELTSSCKTCHIRDMVPARALRQKVQAITRKNGADPDLCGPAEVQSIRIDITQDCNLRCVYCAVSQPNYAGVHMSQEVFDKVFTMIPTGRDSVRIDLNGHGETTFHPHWVDYVTRVQKTGAATTLLSNFAKPFSEAEISAFAHVGFIQISLDTVDDSMLRDIRRKVSLETIVGNIKKIKDYAKANALHPMWSISCGIYDKNVFSLGELAAFIIQNRFNAVTFWNLVEYPMPSNTTVQVRALESLPQDEKQRAVKYANRIVDQLRRSGVDVDVAGNFLAH